LAADWRPPGLIEAGYSSLQWNRGNWCAQSLD